MNNSPYKPPIYKEPPEPEYEPRSLLSKLIPLILSILLPVLLFVVVHFVANEREELLTGNFLIYSPFFIGAWIAYFSKLDRPTSTKGVLKNIFNAMLFIMVISIPILREGIICLIMASPIIFLAMLMGGLLMSWFCDKIWKSKALHSLAILPLLVLFIPIEEQTQLYQSEKSIIINAQPAQIWQSINHIENISAKDFYQKSKLLPFMQVPTPKSAITIYDNNKQQFVRKCQWQGNIYFDEPIIAQIPNQQLKWNFVFYNNSVPKGTLDDHVTINGKYFKLLNGQYDIQEINKQQSKLTFKVDYAITTNINFYAGMWGQWVMNEFVEDVLGLYKNQLESKQAN